jgi:hypothetical protein
MDHKHSSAIKPMKMVGNKRRRIEKMKKIRFWSVLLLLVLLITACGQKTMATPTTDPQAVLTNVAKTVAARLAAITSATPIPTSMSTSTVTPTFLPSLTPFQSTITGTLTVPVSTLATVTSVAGSEGDKVIVVSDLDVTDGTLFDSGAKFTKTWRLMNAGTSTWTTGYSLVHVGGDEISGPASVPLTEEVGPGKITDLSVDLTAPAADGNYTSYWKLKNASGQVFGIGSSGNDAFWVKIQIGGEANPLPTDTPEGTPSSATSAPSASISDLALEIDDASVYAKCPHTFLYTAKFNISEDATMSYHWEASDSKYTLPAARSLTMQAGDQTVPFSFEVTSSNRGWLMFHITSPEDVSSDQVGFSLACKA